jgi:hypothetical protein
MILNRVAWFAVSHGYRQQVEERCLAPHVPHGDCVDVANPDPRQIQLQLVNGTLTVHQRRMDGFRQL